ncbi:unnamed protein product [Adineta ricciae]|uniref:Uncharacterized protein n=1 Tax=Adineta ricciae TaxID=249248 RepID=A0A814P1H8_ADIRI|nr:unnamed protein product [Adineta ricciae]CAF1267378.1 unnamed protein product [Adineta ricciae]
MSSKTGESDVQLELHFLDCQPDCIDRSLNDQSVLDHLYRAVTQNILQLENSDQRNQSHRITDIDQLVVLLNHVTFTPKSMTKHIPIELMKNDNRQVEIPIIKTEAKHSPMEVQVETTGVIPPAPPLPPSLDLAIKLQKQAMKIEVLSPDKNSLWSSVKNLDVADYFTQASPSTSYQYAERRKESKQETILDARKGYNLGWLILFSS